MDHTSGYEELDLVQDALDPDELQRNFLAGRDDIQAADLEEYSASESHLESDSVIHDMLEVKVELIEGKNSVVETEPSMLSLETPRKKKRGRGDPKGFACSQCPKVFPFLFLLNGHMRSHTPPRRTYRCAECDKEFRSSSQLKKHRELHEGQDLYKCSECFKCFNDLTHLKAHARIHTGEMPFGCMHCGKCFSQASSLRVHFRLHSGESPARCLECNTELSLENGLHHFASANSSFKCDKCIDNCPKEQKEEDESIRTADGPFECSHCNQSYFQEGKLREHLIVHSGDQPFSCEFCNEKFDHADHLKEHYQSHTGENPFQCQECGYCFRYQYALRNHQNNTCNRTVNNAEIV